MQEDLALETVICPVCGRPFPKRRRELGYRHCVNCSTEESVSCVIEGSMEGNGDDTVYSNVVIVSGEQGRSIENSRKKYLGNVERDYSLENFNNPECDLEEEELVGFSRRSEEDLERMDREDLESLYYEDTSDSNTTHIAGEEEYSNA